MAAEEKLASLRRLLRSQGRVGVAYSGGLDSSLLLMVAVEELGQGAVGLMAVSPAFPARERQEAIRRAEAMGARLVLVPTDELGLEDYASNPDDRCYHCKSHIMRRLMSSAAAEGIVSLVDGINADDLHSHRHGLRAAQELGVRSPLAEVGLGKEEIRALARSLGLGSADRPHSACLASRIPYGERITEEKLGQVEMAEDLLRGLGAGQLRVRHHGQVARIEVLPADFPLVLAHREEIAARLRSLGFSHVCLDLEGFRSGSLERA
jgi:uncharacterized protein